MIEWYLPPAGAPDGWPWTTRGYDAGMDRRPRKPVRVMRVRWGATEARPWPCPKCQGQILGGQVAATVSRDPDRWAHVRCPDGLAEVVGQDPAIKGAAVVAGPSGVADSDGRGGGDVGGVDIAGAAPAPAETGH